MLAEASARGVMMAAKTGDLSLDDRARRLLKALVERFIQDAQPVGSRTLSRDSGLELSPATVRNVMSDLEEMGLVSAPHTSAGRVPTVRGYRLFIDTLLKVQPLSRVEVQRLRDNLETSDDFNPQSIISTASNLLSGITNMAGIVTLPRRDHSEIRQLEFVPLSAGRILAILVFSDHEVQNRILHVEREYTPSELQQASNYLNSLFAGRGLMDVRQCLLNELSRTREDMNETMRTAVEMAGQVFAGSDEEDYVMAGQVNLMNFKELSDVDKLRRLFEAFTTKQDILHLLDQCVSADGVQIFIGEESGYKVLDECSVVTAPYEIDDHVVGVLGVIGPTRMAYDRVIPIVDVTARLLGAALNSRD